jgi:DNA polymerase-4
VTKRDSVSDTPRAIAHLDLDAFFAAVEILENPDLEGKPVLVGGQPGGRGVVTSASYPARAFGIRSAMPTSRALGLCPDAIVLPPRHPLYRRYSRRVMQVLRQASPLVEQASIDEAYLDLTSEISAWDAATEIARRIQWRVREEVGLSASLGVATNKLVAKVASDQGKPGGLTVVRPGEEAAFLGPLPVRVLWGVGPVTARRLAQIGVTTVGDLAQMPEAELRDRLGRYGTTLVRMARGIDHRPVVTQRERRSVSQERTFARDVTDAEALKGQLWQLSQGVANRLRRMGLAAGAVSIKLRYSDFTTLTRQMTLPLPTDDERVIYRVACTLVGRAWEQGRPVRLLGIAARALARPAAQLPLW